MRDQIIQELDKIKMPNGQSIVALDMVRALTIDEGNVQFVIEAPSAAVAGALESLRQQAVEAVTALAGVNKTSVILTAHSGAAEKPEPPQLKIGGHPKPQAAPMKPAGVARILAIASGKGGVGKSTVSSNLAVALAKQGRRVGLLDADIYGPSIPTMFDMEGARPLSVQVDGKSMMEPIENYGVKVLSIGFFTKPEQAVIWRGPMAAKALNQMIFDASWGELDFLLIDLPPGTGDIHLSIVQSLPLNGAVVVSTPQNVALADAKKGISMFQQENIQVPVLGIIENMSYFTPPELPDNKYYIFGKKGAEYLAKDKEVPFLGALPIEQSVREAADAGRPAALQVQTPIAIAFQEISKKLVSQVLFRNKNLPPTKAVEITNLVGCEAIK